VEKQPTHIIGIETKYSAAHYKRHWMIFSSGCFKHDEKIDCMDC